MVMNMNGCSEGELKYRGQAQGANTRYSTEQKASLIIASTVSSGSNLTELAVHGI